MTLPQDPLVNLEKISQTEHLPEPQLDASLREESLRSKVHWYACLQDIKAFAQGQMVEAEAAAVSLVAGAAQTRATLKV